LPYCRDSKLYESNKNITSNIDDFLVQCLFVSQENFQDLITRIRAGQIGVMPTDTIYGIVASVKFPESIEKIYQLTGRPGHKPFIVLISDHAQLSDLKIKPTEKQIEALGKLWPGAVSTILPCNSSEMGYLHRGKKSIAVRLTNLDWLNKIINETGPIVATSANLPGEPTPNQISQIREDLPDFDFYVSGEVGDSPSRLVQINQDGSLFWIERQ
jgi:L-threonylcarbamoyladenylate synthase